MLKIKFGPHADRVPLSWMVGRMRQRIQSRKSGGEKLGYLKGSLQVLLNALLAKLSQMGVVLHNKSRVDQIEFQDGKISSLLCGAKSFKADKYLFTIPSPHLAPLFSQGNLQFSKALAKQAYFGAVCTILTLTEPLTNIYWLNIADPDYPFGGIIEHTNFISPQHYNNKHIVYLSRYFSHQEEIAKLPDNQIKELMLNALWKMFPQYNKANLLQVRVFKTRTAAPVCDLNYSSSVLNMQSSIPNAYLCNMQHVYPDERSTNNSIRIAAEACITMNLGGDQIPRGLSLSGQIGTKAH
jgi:protoporphyrinogen oxidase